MMIALNETHDPTRRSFVASANAADSEFPIQNLPFGVFGPAAGLPARVGVAIGDQVLDVAAAASALQGSAKLRIWIICCRSGRRLGRRCGSLCRAA
jgi:fumarylacetoacetase